MAAASEKHDLTHERERSLSAFGSLELFLGRFRTHLSSDVLVKEKKRTRNSCEIQLAAGTQLVQRVSPNSEDSAIDKPINYLEWRPQEAEHAADMQFLGFQCAEFALPVRAASSNLQFAWFQRTGFWRPRSAFPMLVFAKSSNLTLLLAPLDNFHEQVLVPIPGHRSTDATSEPQKSRLRWGWSGDLKNIPNGFATTLYVSFGTSARALLAEWGSIVRERSNVVRQTWYCDASVSRLSMWTDNGSAYWYRKEKAKTLPQSLKMAVSSLQNIKVPVGSIELDSWFYPHQLTRQITDIGYLDVVPPTGLLRWEPREDVLGSGGITALRKYLGDFPLILHCRHISSQSSYVTDTRCNPVQDDHSSWWIDRDRAHPKFGDLFYTWMQQARDWGATAFEQDWIVETWLGVRQLREEPGRIFAWQQALNDAACDANIVLIWCMATPADMAVAASLSQIATVRTSDDYRYASDPSVLWRWFLTVNCLVRGLGFSAFKDVFMSNCENESGEVDIDGDPNAELEALLSAMSCGPVGIGDRAGRTDRNIVMRTCRADGVLIKPDIPLAALDQSLSADPDENPIIWADTFSSDWRYIVAIHAAPRRNASGDAMDDCLSTDTLVLDGGNSKLVYDWRAGAVFESPVLNVSLKKHDWRLYVVCPSAQTRCCDGKNRDFVTLIGDVNAYATMGLRRVRIPQNGLCIHRLEVTGEPGEVVKLGAWTSKTGLIYKNVVVPNCCWTKIDLQVQAWVAS